MITDAQGNVISPFHSEAYKHKNDSDWILIYKSDRGYSYWKHIFGFYNVSSDNNPPIYTEAGYNNLLSLMSLKNESWWTMQKVRELTK